ncbi:MAG: hypothetical protein II880_02360 [Schwartzia sp.]|jgi:hypothetical protein|nr:hypothetical protein [Schwartzia sp. (in: firmicutes)]
MRSFTSRLLAFFAFAVLCTVLFPQPAAAKPKVRFTIEHVYLHEAGEAEIVGYFENSGDEAATVEWVDLDLTLLADNGQQMWSDAGIRHYPDGIEVLPGDYVAYTYYVQNPDIPEYHGKYRWRFHSNTHWVRGVG